MMAPKTRSSIQKASKLANKNINVDRTRPISNVSDKASGAARSSSAISKSSRAPPSSSPSALICRSSSDFERWLTLHHTTDQEVWLKIAKKSRGMESITPDEALDLALCHGWIDGTGRSLDTAYHLRRYTPRRPRSVWSVRNKLKVERLISKGRMTEKGMMEVHAAQSDGRWERAYAGPKTMVLPKDLRDALLAQDRPDLVKKIEDMSNAERYRTLLKVEMSITEDARRKKIDQVIQQLTQVYPA